MEKLRKNFLCDPYLLHIWSHYDLYKILQDLYTWPNLHHIVGSSRRTLHYLGMTLKTLVPLLQASCMMLTFMLHFDAKCAFLTCLIL